MSSAKYQALEAKITEYEKIQQEELDELCHQIDYDFVSCIHKSIVYQTIEKKDINILHSILISLNLLHEKFTRQLECLNSDINEIQNDIKSQSKFSIAEKAVIPLTLGLAYPFLKKTMKQTTQINTGSMKCMINDEEYLKGFVLPCLLDSIKRTEFLIQNFPKDHATPTENE